MSYYYAVKYFKLMNSNKATYFQNKWKPFSLFFNMVYHVYGFDTYWYFNDNIGIFSRSFCISWLIVLRYQFLTGRKNNK